MAWIESHDNLKDHPKTRRAARLLGVSVPTVIGHLHLLWHWCLSYAEDGDLSAYDAADIADAVMWDGDPDQLIEALINCGPAGKAGFLERDAQGRLLVHDWHDYAGKLIEKREEAREAGARGNHERWHVQRGIVDPTCPYCQEASAQDGQVIGSPSGGESGPESEPNRVLSHRTLTVPNSTVHNQEEIDPPHNPPQGNGPGGPPYAEIIGYLNERTGKNFRAGSDNTKRHIKARWREGYTLDDFRTVIDKKAAQWMGTDMEPYLRPQTLFSAKFEAYLNEPWPNGRRTHGEARDPPARLSRYARMFAEKADQMEQMERGATHGKGA